MLEMYIDIPNVLRISIISFRVAHQNCILCFIIMYHDNEIHTRWNHEFCPHRCSLSCYNQLTFLFHVRSFFFYTRTTSFDRWMLQSMQWIDISSTTQTKQATPHNTKRRMCLQNVAMSMFIMLSQIFTQSHNQCYTFIVRYSL